MTVIDQEAFGEILLWKHGVGVVFDLSTGAVISEGFAKGVLEAAAWIRVAEENGGEGVATFLTGEVGPDYALYVGEIDPGLEDCWANGVDNYYRVAFAFTAVFGYSLD